MMTAGTTYDEPYHVARRFASLDRLSGGRAGWNIVTTGNQPWRRVFGEPHMEHDLRYDRGAEFVDAVKALWDTFEDDAFVFDKASGTLFDPDRLHVAASRRPHENLRAAERRATSAGLSGDRTGRISPKGRAFAAHFAEVMFTLQPTEAAGRASAPHAQRGGEAGRRQTTSRSLPADAGGRANRRRRGRRSRRWIMVDADWAGDPLAADRRDLTGLDLDGPLPEIAETVLGTRTSTVLRRDGPTRA